MAKYKRKKPTKEPQHNGRKCIPSYRKIPKDQVRRKGNKLTITVSLDDCDSLRAASRRIQHVLEEAREKILDEVRKLNDKRQADELRRLEMLATLYDQEIASDGRTSRVGPPYPVGEVKVIFTELVNRLQNGDFGASLWQPVVPSNTDSAPPRKTGSTR